MPKITENMRGLGTFLENKGNQVVNQTVSGLKGENQEWDISDIKTPLKNLFSFGLLGGLAKTLFGAYKAGGQQQPMGNPMPQFNFGTTSSDSYTPFDPFAPTQYDMSNMMPMLGTQVTQMFQNPNITRPAIQKTGQTTVFDLSNPINAMQNTGLPMTQEQQAQQQPTSAQTPTVAPPMPKIQPKTMPMPSDLDLIMKGLDPQAMSGYRSLSAPTYQNPMTANRGYFDMNKAGTVGGNYVQGAGWLTGADTAFGKKAEDLVFDAEMRQRIASMYQ